MANKQLIDALQILTLAAGLEPAVLSLIMGLMQNSQDKTAEEFFAEADGIWGDVISKAKAEGGSLG